MAMVRLLDKPALLDTALLDSAYCNWTCCFLLWQWLGYWTSQHYLTLPSWTAPIVTGRVVSYYGNG